MCFSLKFFLCVSNTIRVVLTGALGRCVCLVFMLFNRSICNPCADVFESHTTYTSEKTDSNDGSGDTLSNFFSLYLCRFLVFSGGRSSAVDHILRTF